MKARAMHPYGNVDSRTTGQRDELHMQVVEDEYAQVHPDSLEQVHLMHDTSKLEPLVKEYKQLQQNLEDLVDDVKFRKRHGKKIKPNQVSPGHPQHHGKMSHIRVTIAPAVVA